MILCNKHGLCVDGEKHECHINSSDSRLTNSNNNIHTCTVCSAVWEFVRDTNEYVKRIDL